MTSSSFTRLLTEEASVKRATMTNGKRGSPTTVITSLPCMPLMPVDAETRNRLALDTPHLLLQTFIEGTYTLKRGDVLVLDGTDYPVSVVDGPWPFRSGDPRTRLILEKLET